MDKGNIHRFPVNTWKRILNRRGKRAVNCVVSGRYLLFGRVGHPTAGYFPERDRVATPIYVDVMTDTQGESGPDRKLCEMVLTLEELEEAIALARRDPDATSR